MGDDDGDADAGDGRGATVDAFAALMTSRARRDGSREGSSARERRGREGTRMRTPRARGTGAREREERGRRGRVGIDVRAVSGVWTVDRDQIRRQRRVARALLSARANAARESGAGKCRRAPRRGR